MARQKKEPNRVDDLRILICLGLPGYLPIPSKEVQFCRQLLTKNESSLFVRPYDIVLSVKGITGEVAIAPPNTPSPGENGWLVNQSCLILCADEEVVDPIYLFMYLSSDVGQALLGQISIGAATSLIQLKSLKDLLIPVSPLPKMKEIVSTFQHQVEFQEEIDKLRQKQNQLSKVHWNIKPPS